MSNKKEILTRYFLKILLRLKQNKKIVFFKKIIKFIINNFNSLNLLKYYNDRNFIYSNIIEKINTINNLIKLNKNIIKIELVILDLLNIICPNDIDLVLNIYNIKIENIKMKEFINDFIILTNILINNDNKLINNDDTIIIKKNSEGINLLENKNGCCIYVKLNNKILVIYGLFKDDTFNLITENEYSQEIIKNHDKIINEELLKMPNKFYLAYYDIINICDKIILTSLELIEELKKKYNEFKIIQTKPLILLINEFIMGNIYQKIDILTLLLISNDDDKKVAYILYEMLKTKEKQNVTIEIYNSLHYKIRNLLINAEQLIEKENNKIESVSESNLSYDKRINLLKVPIDVKVKANDKLKNIKSNLQGDGKAQQWLDGLLKIPFGVYNENSILTFKKRFIEKYNIKEISDYEIEKNIKNNKNLLSEWLNYKNNKKLYLQDVRSILDNSVYGHKEAKKQLERIFAQWINGKTNGAVLGLYGPPGTGKTSLIKNGLSKCLKDDNGNARPFSFLPIGGAVNGSTLIGHNYTYVGASWGRIVDILITSKCMNPIIFIDELDKISNTANGNEIISILTHLTDSTQNDEFEDRYYSGIKLDLSKALIIFSFNDLSLIDYVLKDRITLIETHSLKLNEKILIIQNYLLPEILLDNGFNKNDIIIDSDIIKYLIETYTLEAGVRKIKELIIELVREINLQSYYNDIVLPYKITKDFCLELFELKQKIKIKCINKTALIGVVNGLYASINSIGGITFIQAIKFPSDKILDINLTGSLGDSMKESISYSLKLAFNLLTIEKQEEILSNKAFGIHLHCPDGAVKKDGPSAGVAITLTIYSLLMNIPVNNEYAMTGEIDLFGNIKAIGGLDMKLLGAKNAGIKYVLYPEENNDDIEILRKENNCPEDDNFKIIPVNNIKQVLDYCLI